tara:strand:+ start:47292 stop:48209 length:918 start_codon:yes stop_codon:yes gene_type:complete
VGKAKSKITNWSSYNKALVNRGSITFWIDDKATDAWFCTERHGGKGRSNIFSDIAIETALTVKGVFSLLLRATEGFLNSVFQLMGIACVSPGYSCLSKRARVAQIKYKRASRGEVAHVVIDSTGIKTFGEGEWHVKKHGKQQRRRWRKMHLAVDANTHDVIAAEVSLDSVGDNQALPSLLNPLRRKIKQVSADGAYDTKACYRLIAKKGAKATIPPRSNAGYWEDEHPRNEAVEALKSDTLTEWKEREHYHQRSLSETAMYRYKQLISPKLSFKHYDAQVAEILAGVKAMNKVIDLGMPVRQATG